MVLTKTEVAKAAELLKSTPEVADVAKELELLSSVPYIDEIELKNIRCVEHGNFFHDEDIEWLLLEAGLNKNEISALQFEDMKSILVSRVLPIVKMTAINYVRKNM